MPDRDGYGQGLALFLALLEFVVYFDMRALDLYRGLQFFRKRQLPPAIKQLKAYAEPEEIW